MNFPKHCLICLFVFTTLFAVGKSDTQIIDGYTFPMSVFAGDSVALYLNATETTKDFPARLFDINGKEVASFVIPVYPQVVNKDKPYKNGYGYRLSAKIKVPTLKSGLYLIDNNIPLIVKARNAKITVLYALNTANAYCYSGGKSLYEFNSSDFEASPVLSFRRPIPLSMYCLSFHQWLAKQNFSDVGYITDIDMEEFSSIKKSKLLIIPGHSEYWTLQARKNFDRFVNEGNDALILSGNTMWWQVRYNSARDQLSCYRLFKNDPIKNVRLKTINWNDEALKYPITSSIGVDFSYAGYGRKHDKGWDGYKIISKSPVLEGTTLKPGDIIGCPSDESDGTVLAGFSNDKPVIDYGALGFERIEIVGYDLVSRGVSTWVVLKKSKISGTIINTASTDWCSFRGIRINEDIQKITGNMIRKLLNKEDVFSPQQEQLQVFN